MKPREIIYIFLHLKLVARGYNFQYECCWYIIIVSERTMERHVFRGAIKG